MAPVHAACCLANVESVLSWKAAAAASLRTRRTGATADGQNSIFKMAALVERRIVISDQAFGKASPAEEKRRTQITRYYQVNPICF